MLVGKCAKMSTQSKRKDLEKGAPLPHCCYGCLVLIPQGHPLVPHRNKWSRLLWTSFRGKTGEADVLGPLKPV